MNIATIDRNGKMSDAQLWSVNESINSVVVDHHTVLDHPENWINSLIHLHTEEHWLY